MPREAEAAAVRGVLPSTDGRAHDAGAPHTTVHRLVRRFLEPAQDVLVVGLAVALFALMLRTLATIAQQAIEPNVPVRAALGAVLFMLVLVELLRLTVIYLRDHHVSVDVMIEVSLVAALREVMVLGVVSIPSLQLLAVTAFLVTLGVLLRFGDLRRSRHDRAPRPEARPGNSRDGAAGRVPAPWQGTF